MRILSISPFAASYPVSPFGGGKGKFTFTFNSYLVDKQGFDVCVVPWKEQVGGEFKQRTLDDNYVVVEGVYSHDWVRARKYWFKSRFHLSKASRLQRLEVIIDKYKPELVHLHYTNSDFPESLRTLTPNIPLILTAHSSIPYSDFNRVRSGYVYSDKVVFVSRWNQEYVCSNYWDVSDKAQVIHYPASKVFTEVESLPVEYDTIIFVGLLDSRKNLETLVRAIAKIRDEKLVICGDGPDRAKLEQLCLTNGVNAIFHGHVPEKDLKAMLSKAKMMVLPSYKEGFAVAYVESLCCGTPIIGFPPNVAEHEELLGCRVGYPFNAETQNADELADFIDSLRHSELMESGYRQMLSKAARSYFSEERAFGEYISLYQQFTNR